MGSTQIKKKKKKKKASVDMVYMPGVCSQNFIRKKCVSQCNARLTIFTKSVLVAF